MKNFTNLCFAVIASLLMLSCAESFDFEARTEYNERRIPAYPSSIIQLTEPEKEIVQSTKYFAISFLKDLIEAKDGNIVFSPFSLQTAMAMSEVGANGQTKSQIHEAMGFRDIAEEDVAAFFGKIIPAIKDVDPSVKLYFANSFWASEGFEYKDSYASALDENFAAQAMHLDDNPDAAAKQVNDWVSEKTSGNIPKIVDNVQSQFLLINALDFNAGWNFSLNVFETVTKNIFKGDNGNKEVDFMGMKCRAKALIENDAYTIITLPYGKKTNFAMHVIVPGKKSSLSKVLDILEEREMSYHGILEIRDEYDYYLDFSMPKFNADFNADSGIVKELLSKRGIINAFGDADFSGISDAPMNIRDIVHMATISADENGTSASAATQVEFLTGAGTVPEKKHVELCVNKPFIYMITERSTGAILFAGVQREF